MNTARCPKCGSTKVDQYRMITGPIWCNSCGYRVEQKEIDKSFYDPQIEKGRALIVNLCGAPGAGKSTGAAYIFSKIKMHNINAELSTEFAKDKVWEESKAVFENQVYIFGKQFFKLSRVASKVDVVITDAPLFASCCYNNFEGDIKDSLNRLVWSVYNSFDNLTYYVRRVKPYNPAGRFQTEGDSNKVGDRIKTFLDENHVGYFEISGCQEDYDKVADAIISRLTQSCFSSR